MKRRFAVILVFVITGATVNVAVAWGIALFANEVTHAYGRDVPLAWPCPVPNDWGVPDVAREDRSWGVSQLHVIRWAQGPVEHDSKTAFRIQCGWPLRSMQLRSAGETGYVSFIFDEDNRGPFGYIGEQVWPEKENSYLHGAVIRWGAAEMRALPLEPVWGKFALNTILYGAAMWGLWRGPRWVIARRRVKKGKCAKCGYDVQHGTSCAECGWTREK